MAKKFKDQVFIVRENEGTDDEFLNVAEDVNDLCCQNEKVKVGIYKLIKTAIAENKTIIKE